MPAVFGWPQPAVFACGRSQFAALPVIAGAWPEPHATCGQLSSQGTVTAAGEPGIFKKHHNVIAASFPSFFFMMYLCGMLWGLRPPLLKSCSCIPVKGRVLPCVALDYRTRLTFMCGCAEYAKTRNLVGTHAAEKLLVFGPGRPAVFSLFCDSSSPER